MQRCIGRPVAAENSCARAALRPKSPWPFLRKQENRRDCKNERRSPPRVAAFVSAEKALVMTGDVLNWGTDEARGFVQHVAGEAKAPPEKRPLFRTLPPAPAFPVEALGPLAPTA